MASQADVRRIAMAQPGAHEGKDRFAFSVESKGKEKDFVWVWLERTDPRKPRVPNPGVIAVRVRDEADKATLLAAAPEKYFTEPHYRGFPAVLVRLRAVRLVELRALISEAWRCQAPPELVGSPAGKRRRPARPRAAAGRGRAARP
jgi:hypothetical protein